jgi:hypothetical protein
MPTVATTRRYRAGNAALAVVILVEIMIALTVAGGVYYWAEWRRMAQECYGGYSWSWSAPGFTCTSGDGTSVSKLRW